MTKLKVLFLPTNVSGVNFWRIYQFYKRMVAYGWPCCIYGWDWDNHTVGVWEEGFLKDPSVREQIYFLLDNADIVVMGYIHHPHISPIIDLLRKPTVNKPVICEIDDDVLNTPPYNPAYRSGYKPGVMAERVVGDQLRQSDGVIVSCSYLKGRFGDLNKNIGVMPNCLDFNAWKPVKKPKNPHLRIGWIGGGNHEADLEVLRGVIPAVIKKHPEVEWHIVAGVPEYIKKLAKKYKQIKPMVKWYPLAEYREALIDHNFDIGLAPLEFNTFNCGKTNLRYLEYSGINVPTVATNIEPYSKSIINGVNGFLCDNIDGWVKNICTLIEQPRVRGQMAANAYTNIKANHNLDIWTRKYMEFLGETYDKVRFKERG